MKIGVHLHFMGQCQEAFEFYQSLFGGSLEIFTYADSPASQQVPSEWQGKVVHASLMLNDLELARADILPEQYQ